MNSMKDRSKLHHFEIKQSEKHGNGVFSTTAYPKGAVVLNYYKYGRMNQKRDKHSIEFRIKSEEGGDDVILHIIHDVGASINHSNKPNLNADPYTGDMVANRHIAKGEELTFNYHDTESHISNPFEGL